MPRVPLLPADVTEPKDLVEAVRARRGGPLLDLDRLLLHSPAFTQGWNALMAQVRGGLSLDARLRELAVCAVAVLNGAEFEFVHHSPLFLEAGGTQAQLEALRRESFDDEVFDAPARAVLTLSVEMTRQVKVSDATFEAARAVLPDDQQMVELVGLVAAYNMVSRFLVALDL